MIISQVYQKFKIMPSLQDHQLRVAAVAKIICDNLQKKVDTRSIVAACLLHDMGNILKFDLNKFPDFLEPEGLDYWQQVKNEFSERYGDSEHEASMAIAKKLKVSKKVLELIDSIGFRNIEDHFLSKDLEKMICEYADCRVAPWGVVSLDERLKDLEERYGFKYPGKKEKIKREKYYDLERQSEKYIFAKLNLQPKDISSELVNDTILGLKSFEIS